MQDDVSGTLYTGAGYFHMRLPGSVNPPKASGSPFPLSAIEWDSAQMDSCSLCLTPVQRGAQVCLLQAAKVNISTPKSKNTGPELRIQPFCSAICYHR